MAYVGQFEIENLLPGLNGQSVGSNLSSWDFSGTTTFKLPAGTTIGGSAVAALGVITSASATALAVGLAGATNSAFVVDSSTATQAAGLKITGAVAAGDVDVSVISSGAAASLSINSKGAGNIYIGDVATGLLSIGRTTSGTIFGGVVNTAIATQNATPTAANLIGGLITHASTTGAGTLQLPTGTQMDTAVPTVTNGDNFWVVYANTGNQTVTITAGSGFTITGTAAVPTLKNAQIFCVRTGTNTWIGNITLSA
jgi:hypothetical protein